MTRKSLILPAAIALACLATGCNKSMPETIPTNDTINVDRPEWDDTITISIGFGPGAAASRTRASLDDVKMKDLWLFDYVGGSLVQSIHQTSTDEGFGSLSLGVTYGTHTFYVVASGGSDATTDGSTITWGKPGETFYLSHTADLQPSGAKSLSMELKRISTRLRVLVTDEIPSDLAQMAITGTWYYTLDYLTGEASGAQSATRSVSVPSSYIGTTGQLSVGFHSLCPVDGYTSDITIAARRSDESAIKEVALSGVAFERNRQTVASGGLSSSTRSIAITVDDAWADAFECTW